ncbi:MAG: ABC transporter ATP-binding protein, partial [Deltaproteobacteria bacterium]|nr:ABC transporter ATP-binding protein [Deltaproteobacteria bacterium]
MLILDNVHKSFTHNGILIEVLKGIDLKVDAGDTL